MDWTMVGAIATIIGLIVTIFIFILGNKIEIDVYSNSFRIVSSLLVGIIIAAVIYLLWSTIVPPPPPHIISKVSVDDYTFPPWADIRDPAKDKSIKWEYEIDCKSNRLCWATLNLESEKEQDISNYTGISFSIKANKAITTK